MEIIAKAKSITTPTRIIEIENNEINSAPEHQTKTKYKCPFKSLIKSQYSR